MKGKVKSSYLSNKTITSLIPHHALGYRRPADLAYGI